MDRDSTLTSPVQVNPEKARNKPSTKFIPGDSAVIMPPPTKEQTTIQHRTVLKKLKLDARRDTAICHFDSICCDSMAP